jgi:hypothetical protein
VVGARAGAGPVDNPAGQLDAAAAGAELLELESLDELEPLDEVELDFSDDDFSDGFSDDDEELVDSELLAEPLDALVAAVLADSRLSLR